MCVACRQTAGQRELVRLVRRPDGAVVVDAAKRSPGRGAYVHADPACVELARKRRALERALRGAVPPEVWDAVQLRQSLPRGAPSGEAMPREQVSLRDARSDRT